MEDHLQSVLSLSYLTLLQDQFRDVVFLCRGIDDEHSS